MKKTNKNIAFNTKCVHVGNHPDKETGSVTAPIYQTSTYIQQAPGVHKGYEYTRSHNPTRTRLEEALAALEGAKYAITTSSGLSASMLMMNLVKTGSNILCGDDVYGGTYRMFTTVYHEKHNFTFIDTTNLKLVKESLEKYKPALIWLETPTNPLLKISDIKKICELAKKTKTKVIVDNTFMGPYFQNPITLGADYVIHSMTKYIGGHSDVLGGVIITNSKAEHNKLFTLHNSIGPCASPFESWLFLRSLKTLHVRMKRHEENAKAIAKFLEKHPQVEKVSYPGLKSHPQHSIAKKQMKGFGGMITFYLKGDIKNARKFLKNVNIFSLAESLGGVESLIEHPAIMTHASVPKKIRQELGIEDNLIRLSIGIEEESDLIADLQTAFQSSL
jgi:cystathionine gamma-lyase